MMLNILQNDMYELNDITIIVRLVLAVVIGGIVGTEREIGHKVAGLRTHMLVALGASAVMITNQYISESFIDAHVDITRLGAQVISGIGFLGAGTILTTSTNKVSGLTTAAGLWTTAVLGLTVGIGFYKLAIFGTISILVITILLNPFKRKIASISANTDFSISAYSVDGVRGFIKYSNEHEAHLSNFYIDEESIYRGDKTGTAFHATISLSGDTQQKEFIEGLKEVSGIKFVDKV